METDPDRLLDTVPASDADFYQALARAIRSLRSERGLERRALAERAGISYPYLSEIETGKKRPSSQTLLAVAQALAVRPHELVGLAEALARQAAGVEQAPAAAPAASEPPAARRSRFFHTPPAAEAARPATTPSPRPVAAAPWRASPPRSLTAVMAELRGYLERLAPEDIERVLDLARRLSR